ncbi:Theronine dehydrogenase-like Zn-dependent dehydrogenase [Corynebacterium camporealensis]|uniref:Theronine dehydrogenase-like Zn-dependent dehydrogenase n=1 Tax=Corynebacterium camporealensis TaxID=161896 RepID=A0A0F6QX90_9CORY|nr:theronine dehydrogenase-like Zn-dependent dehydrogenase [Corynebacterium camporealensis]AVH87845.1 Theronine dehydrogenase-like Zn-dependent dehydrogenase [Corynebacterium camporealensis]
MGYPPEITQGHECSGEIVELGDAVTGWEVGDKVIPSAGRSCGKCRQCRRGNPAQCLNTELMAFQYDDAWAQYTLSGASGLVRVPEGVPMDQAAILADAVATPFGAVKRTGEVKLGNAVAVWGLGGVGTHIVQLAKLAGAVPVIGVDINDDVLERAKRLGADHVFRSDDPDLMDKIEEVTRGRMIDVAFDAVGIQPTMKQAIDSLDRGGRAVLVGLSDQELNAGNMEHFGLQALQVHGHLGYKPVDIYLLTELVQAGRLDLSESVSKILPLDDIEKGIEIMESKEGNPIRVLIDPWADEDK